MFHRLARLLVARLTREASTSIDPPADCSEYILQKSERCEGKEGKVGREGRRER